MRPSVVLVSLVTATALACSGGPDASGADAGPDAPDAADGLTTLVTLPANENHNLDLLIVMDNSGSMGEEQAALAANLPVLINELARPFLPDLHVGVVSSNVGTGGQQIFGCSQPGRPEGDDGALLTSGCPNLTGSYLSDLRQPDGSRFTNYTGDLSAVFGCLVRLGTTGCGYEQHLESMKRALSPGRNPGFLRTDAFLAVLIVADEDDCSALPGGAMFGDPTATVTSALGPRTSFRCFEFGDQCVNDPDPRAFGPRTECIPRASSPYMPTPQPYVDFLRGLKADPRGVVVGGIIGDVSADRHAEVVPDPDDATRPALAPSCQGANGVAAPGFRLQTFLDAFALHSVATICNDNPSDALADFAHQIRDAMGDPCVPEELVDVDPAQVGLQPRCEVTETTLEMTTVIPSCDRSAPPCWRFINDPVACPDSFDSRALEIDRAGMNVPLGTIDTLRCEIVP